MPAPVQARHAQRTVDPTDPVVAALLAALNQAYWTKSWHGTNLNGAIRRLKPADAAWRPGRDRHNIWEIVVHCAYWKYAVWRRLTGAPRGSFPYKGSDWFVRPAEPSSRAWRDDRALLAAMHERLIDAVAAQTPRSLAARARRSAFASRDLILGAAAHDVYHTGQIQLIKRLHSAGAE